MYNSSKANKQAGSNVYGSKMVAPKLQSYNAKAGAKDYEKNLPSLTRISEAITQERAKEREDLMPGSKQIMARGASDINALLLGDIPDDVKDNIRRIVAEKSGGEFDPSQPGSFGGGGNRFTDDLRRSLGKTSLDLMDKGLAVAPTWETLANSFVYGPEDAANTALSFLKQRYDYATQQYRADQNTSLINAAPDPTAVGQRNDAAALMASQQNSGTGAGGGYATEINGLVAGLQGLQTAYKDYKTSSTMKAQPSVDWRASAVGY